MSKAREIVIILIVTILSLAGIQQAGAGNMIVTSLTANDGLSNNTVWAVLQDKAGFIWVGTTDGLDRYDGREIRHFSPDRQVGENSYIQSLCEDDSGLIWIGTNSGLCIFDPETEQESVFPLGLADVDDATIRVYQIVKVPDGSLWIPAGRYGFIRIDPKTKEVRRLSSSADGSVSYFGAAMCFDGRDSFYLVMEDGNIYSSNDELQSVNALFRDPVLDFQPRILTYAFGSLFTGTAENNIKIDIRTREVTRTKWSVIRVSSPSPNDELWASDRFGLHILDPNLNERMEITMDMGSRLAFQGKSIMCACRDRDGNIWVGTYYSGVFHLINNRSNLQKYYPRFIDDDEPCHVREIIPDREGMLWVATEDKGLLRFSIEEGSFKPVRLPLSVMNIQALCDDGQHLWIGAFAQSNALVKLDKKDGSAKLFDNSPQRIYSICVRHNGIVAIGGSDGLFFLKDGKFYKVSRITGVVQEVMEDSHEHLWISTGKDGLWCCMGDPLEPSTQWHHFVNDPEDAGSLPSNKVTSVFEDRLSRIWVTTESGGFCLLNSQTGSFTRYAERPGTAYKVCYKISEDKNGLLWITTSKGMLCFYPQTDAATLLTRKDGMLSNQYNYASNVISQEGVLYAGSGEGMVSFEPDKIMQWPRNSSVMLTDFLVVEPRSEKPSRFHLSGSINTLSSITLRHKYNSFRIKVATDNYSIPVINRTVYRFEGIDNEWIDITDGIIEINKLKSGRYKLSIGIKRINGDLEPEKRTLDITVRPPLMASIPAILSYLLILVALFFVARRLAERKMAKQHVQDLLNAQMEFVTAMSHEIKTPLTLVQGSMELVRNGSSSTDSGPWRKNLDVAMRNLDRIRELVSQLQDFSSVQFRGHAPKMSQVDLVNEVNSIFQRFTVNAQTKQVSFEIELPDCSVFAWTDRDAMDKILTNIFSNAIKYAEVFAHAYLTIEDHKCRLVVVNDGMLIPPDMAGRIFEPFVRYTGNSKSIPGMGIGLSTSRKLARMLGGDIIYRRTEQGHNSFNVEIPIRECSVRVQDAAPAITAVQPAGGIADENKSVLIVEDTPEMKDFIVEQLSSEYSILSASNGEEALSILGAGRNVGLVLSDVMMPGIDGFELCHRLKENIMTSHIPVILLTAKTDTGSKIEGLGSGADMYLEKPFSMDHLKAAIRNVFENREQLRRHYLSHPLDTDAGQVGSSVDSDFLKRLVSFVESNIETESIRIADIAQAAFVSESNLYRKTKALLGMTPNEYVQFIRLKVAESLLGESDIPISDIVARTGFRSHSYFSACFKKQYGITPGQYRKEKSQRKDTDKNK